MNRSEMEERIELLENKGYTQNKEIESLERQIKVLREDVVCKDRHLQELRSNNTNLRKLLNSEEVEEKIKRKTDNIIISLELELTEINQGINGLKVKNLVIENRGSYS